MSFGPFGVAVASFWGVCWEGAGRGCADLGTFRTFVRFVLVYFVCFLLVSGKCYGLQLWYSLDFSLTFLAHLSQRLEVSFCDRSMSVVRRASSVVRRASSVVLLSTIYLKDNSS